LPESLPEVRGPPSGSTSAWDGALGVAPTSAHRLAGRSECVPLACVCAPASEPARRRVPEGRLPAGEGRSVEVWAVVTKGAVRCCLGRDQDLSRAARRACPDSPPSPGRPGSSARAGPPRMTEQQGPPAAQATRSTNHTNEPEQQDQQPGVKTKESRAGGRHTFAWALRGHIGGDRRSAAEHV
jgi:hypothetical protein